MNIVKTRFLLVSCVLSLSVGLGAVMVGCSFKSEDSPAPLPHDPSGDTKEGVTTDPAPGSNPTPTPTPTPQDSGTTADGGGTKDGGEGGTPPVACLDDKTPAAPPACPANGECQAACDEFAAAYKKGVSAEIRKCLTANICESGTAPCVDKALAKACADPTASAFCTPLVTGCKAANGADTITQASCESVAKGLNADGRTTFTSCMETQGNCGDCVPMMK